MSSSFKAKVKLYASNWSVGRVYLLTVISLYVSTIKDYVLRIQGDILIFLPNFLQHRILKNIKKLLVIINAVHYDTIQYMCPDESDDSTCYRNDSDKESPLSSTQIQSTITILGKPQVKQ